MTEETFEIISWQGKKSGPFTVGQIQEKWDADKLSGVHQVIVGTSKPLVKEFLQEQQSIRDNQELIAEQNRKIEEEKSRQVIENNQRLEREKLAMHNSSQSIRFSESKEFYLHIDNIRKGPYSKENLRVMYRAGKITDTTQVWTEDLGDWIDFKGYKDSLGDIDNGGRSGFFSIRRVLGTYGRSNSGWDVNSCYCWSLCLTFFYGESYWYSEEMKGPFDILLTGIFPFVATLLFWSFKQATPGKLAFGIRIANAEDGSKPSTGQYFGRYFAYILATLPLLMGIFWIAINKRKQGWHDLLSSTIVIYDK